MELNTYIRKPFTVEAVEITAENIEEVAAIVGEIRTKSDVPFIAIDRRIVPNIRQAFIGWYLTKLGDNYRCYSPKVFNEQFTAHAPGTGYFFDEETEEEVVPLTTSGIVTEGAVEFNIFTNTKE